MAAQARALAFEGDQRGAARLGRRALAEPAPATPSAPRPRRRSAGRRCSCARRSRTACHARLAVGLAGGLGDRALAANALGVQGLIEATLGRHEAPATFARALDLDDVPTRATAPVARFDQAAFLMWADALDESAAILRDSVTRPRPATTTRRCH